MPVLRHMRPAHQWRDKRGRHAGASTHSDLVAMQQLVLQAPAALLPLLPGKLLLLLLARYMRRFCCRWLLQRVCSAAVLRCSHLLLFCLLLLLLLPLLLLLRVILAAALDAAKQPLCRPDQQACNARSTLDEGTLEVQQQHTSAHALRLHASAHALRQGVTLLPPNRQTEPRTSLPATRPLPMDSIAPSALTTSVLRLWHEQPGKGRLHCEPDALLRPQAAACSSRCDAATHQQVWSISSAVAVRFDVRDAAAGRQWGHVSRCGGGEQHGGAAATHPDQPRHREAACASAQAGAAAGETSNSGEACVACVAPCCWRAHRLAAQSVAAA